MEPAELPARLSTTQRVRDLWVLREQAKVRETEFRFLRELESILNRHVLQIYTREEKKSYVRKQLPFECNNCTKFDREEQAQSSRDSLFQTNSVAPTRERNCRRSSVAEVQMIQQSRPVTGLSAEYRSLLEGNAVSPPQPPSWFGGDLWRQVIEQQTVSNALNSSFRHRLEFALLHSQSSLHSSSASRSFPSYDGHSYWRRQESENWEDFSDIQHPPVEDIETSEANNNSSLLNHIEKLQTDIQWIKNTMQASFDLQLEIQREIRQELAGILHDYSKTANSSLDIHSKAISKGTCIVCAQNSIDALLYSCGHMCTCCYCGRQLIATGQTCPICRAPVKDVVRAYSCGEC